jgi:photosystem II stability/assembly factor-like uncharacterized protein
MRLLALLLLLALPESTHWWTVQSSGIDTNLRAISYFSTYAADIVWTSGSNGVVLRSNDEGKTWKRLHVSGGEKLDFRGVQAVSLNTAYLMSIGEGEKSRIYKTTDAGTNWTLQYTANRQAIFLDGISCISEINCFAISDPIDGKFLILTTTNGTTWNELPRDEMPAALPNEGIFAASNSAFLVSNNEIDKTIEILFATGGPAARVFHSNDGGHTWTVSETPITHSNASSGIFSLYKNGNLIYAVGGDYKAPDRNTAVAAHSTDNGRTWKLSSTQPSGFRSAIAVCFDGSHLAAVGPTGADMSMDEGVNWNHTDDSNLNAMAGPLEPALGWAVGPHGTIAHFKNHIRIIMRNQTPTSATDSVAANR